VTHLSVFVSQDLREGTKNLNHKEEALKKAQRKENPKANETREQIAE